MVPGYAGKILRVDLTTGNISVDEPEEEFYRTYLGGAGFVSYFLLKEVPPGIDAFSPQNKIIYALGPMVGHPMPGATRSCIGAKSPLTDGYAKTEAGGFVPAEIKKAGYDAIIIEGKAKTPVYLLVTDATVELRDAAHIWGKTTLETQDIIAEDTGVKRVKTAAIGVGGENMVRYACVMNDVKDAHGRGGVGAVMGSKNLKAIASFGKKPPIPVDPGKIRAMAVSMNKEFYDDVLFNKSLAEVGTGIHDMMVAGNEVGNQPSHNFGVNDFPETARITATATMEEHGAGMEGCAACRVRCKKTVEIEEPWNVDKRSGGPEYESLVSLGSTCGVDDLAAIIKGNELANHYSLDSISLGVSIAFGMECFENGIIGLEDTGGLDLRFGNAEGMLEAIELIARREGIGNLLAEGVLRASQELGKDSEEFAVHVKGVEVPMHDPRVKQGLAVIYSVEAAGADHCAGMHDTLFTQDSPGFEHIRGMGAIRPLPADDLGGDKVANEKAVHMWAMFRDSLVACQFVPWSIDEQVEIVRAVTGWSYTTHEALKLGQRIATLGRLYNLREGITSSQDVLPKRMFQPTKSGALSKDGGLDPAKMENAVRLFYGMMGWDEDTGIPRRSTLAELGLSWTIEEEHAIASA
ncbi:MAG: aldehyde ferredoxin oxidoreductase family protein [Candidatus Latescibacteria bacterium]|nr:aldehyde ferredoxin oxidoreductase family protein [Candidatus Latescibacterota bacterium]